MKGDIVQSSKDIGTFVEIGCGRKISSKRREKKNCLVNFDRRRAPGRTRPTKYHLSSIRM